MFDFTPVGLGIAAAGIDFLAFGYRLIRGAPRGAATLDAALESTDYGTEALVAPNAEVVGQTSAEFHKLAEDEVKVAGIVRNEKRSAKLLPYAEIRENDLLLLEGEPLALERVVTSTGLKLSREHRRPEAGEALDEIGVIEAVIGPGSVLIGQTAERMALYERFHVNLIAVSRAGERLTERLRTITLRPGDVIVLQGNLTRLPD